MDKKERFRGYICIRQQTQHELVIKKSRFLCSLIPVETEQQAADELAKIKKKHYNAAHNCSAMVIGPDSSFLRSSDDGEPQGTAGVPMLEVLKRSGVTNILAVVTRYFGGTLLGAGGLVRAYSQSVSEALREAQLEKKTLAVQLDFSVEYADYAKLMNIANEYGATVEAEFGEKVNARMTLEKEYYPAVAKKVSGAFLGAAVYREAGECYVGRPVSKESFE